MSSPSTTGTPPLDVSSHPTLLPGSSSVPFHKWDYFGEASSSQPTASQESAIDDTNDEAIVKDIIAGCAEDKNDFFFDELGSPLTNTSTKVPPVEHPEPPPSISSEDIYSFEVFAGPQQDPFFIESKEQSDVEIEPTN